jgi:predicted benzoate:H+ symporter BenE
MTAQANDHGSEVVRVRRRRIRLAVVSAVLVAGVVAVIVAFAGKVKIIHQSTEGTKHERSGNSGE